MSERENQAAIVRDLRDSLNADNGGLLIEWVQKLKRDAGGFKGVGELLAPIRLAASSSPLILQAFNDAWSYGNRLRREAKGKERAENWGRVSLRRGDWRGLLAELEESLRSSEILEGPWVPASRCIVPSIPGLTDATGVRRWCEQMEIPTRKPAANRLEVHQPRFDESVAEARRGGSRYKQEMLARIADAKEQRCTKGK